MPSANYATLPPYLWASEFLQPWRSKCAVVPLGLGDVASAAPNATPDTVPPQSTSSLAPRHPAPAIHWSSHLLQRLRNMIEAVANMPGVELLIVGDGELHAPLQTLIDHTTPTGQAPAVRLLGSVDDAEKNALLHSCDVFCLASRERTEAFIRYCSKPWPMVALASFRNCRVSACPGSLNNRGLVCTRRHKIRPAGNTPSPSCNTSQPCANKWARPDSMRCKRTSPSLQPASAR